jgi:hypothetical protein
MSVLAQVTKVPVKVQFVEYEIAPAPWIGAACLFAGIGLIIWFIRWKSRNRRNSGDQLDD